MSSNINVAKFFIYFFRLPFIYLPSFTMSLTKILGWKCLFYVKNIVLGVIFPVALIVQF